MNYKIVQDEEILSKFLNWLPECKPNEQYICVLLARNKYLENRRQIKSKIQLKRFTSQKQHLFRKIKQLEIEFGWYQDDGAAIPQDALTLYINPNPRDLEKATAECLKRFSHLVTQPYTGYNPHQEALNCIQESRGTGHFLDFDFDHVEEVAILDELEGQINKDCLHILKTKGGFHLLVELGRLDPKYKKTWYNAITKLPGVDVKGDNLIPVPGCLQGGFTPYFLNKKTVFVNE